MSSLDQSLHACADLFCEFYDEIDDDLVRQHWIEWERDSTWQSLKRAFWDDVRSGRPVNGLATRVNSGEHRDRRLLAALCGMDEAFRYVNPTMKGGERTPIGLVALEFHVAARGRLDSGRCGGALIPRLVRSDDPSVDVSHKRDLFSYVLRVPDESWQRCTVLALGNAHGFEQHVLTAGLDVACVPVIADPGELSFEVHDEGDRRLYRIGPRDLSATLDRIPAIVSTLRQSGAEIAVAPEATLTPALLRRWQESLRRGRGGRLRWVLAGTGYLEAGGLAAANTAVLLDGRTGAVIGRQDKLYPFNLSAEVLARWGLTSRLGVIAVAEDLAKGPLRVTVFDAGVVRLAILICEDLSRLLDVGPLIRDLGISHLLVPVFSRALKTYRWEQAAGAVYVREAGTAVVVSNSMAMASILVEADPGTCLVVTADGAGAVVGRSADPAEPVCFRLTADGSAELR